ncbi:MAG: phenylacetate--CoA ligase, partial [Betaproteobacteria bacterium]
MQIPLALEPIKTASRDELLALQLKRLQQGFTRRKRCSIANPAPRSPARWCSSRQRR